MSDTHPAPAAPTPPPGRGKGGRPKIDPAAVRRATIGVRVSAAEHAALRSRAEDMGMTPAQFLRSAALTRRLPSPPVPAINRESYANLARLANNINQLTRRANEGKLTGFPAANVKLLRVEIKQLRAALLGLSGHTP